MMSNYTSLYKDKKNLHTRSNTRYNDRNLLDIQLKRGLVNTNLNRIDIERDEFMKQSRVKNINDEDSFDDDNFNNFASTKNTNRITDLDFNNFKSADRGMPIRDRKSTRLNSSH